MKRRNFLKNSLFSLFSIAAAKNEILLNAVKNIELDSKKVLLYLIKNKKGEWKIRCTSWIDLPKKTLRISSVYIKTFKPLEIVDNKNAQKRRMELWKLYNCSGRTGANIDVVRSQKGGLMRKNEARILFKKIASIGGKTSHKLYPELYKKIGSKLGKKRTSLFFTCPHCKKIGKTMAMFTWHFDNCLKNPKGPKKLRIEIRNTNGEKNPKSVLSNEQASLIRDIYIPYHKNFGATALSKKYKVSRNIINKIVCNLTYKNIKPPNVETLGVDNDKQLASNAICKYNI